ncbi:hypothetical protein CBR_g26064 [Chara braunii]|uniref:Chromo domain-containing protein n=1 Tax=Chara braunii TaxID=69332 RepID=A0A388JVU0_CHABU|nr:hypothetical protein CBR_g26064 [Chara braunii]|eukprot:GBG61900.1 hypothetical protein CBR_g26064 [Chara braunii]
MSTSHPPPPTESATTEEIGSAQSISQVTARSAAHDQAHADTMDLHVVLVAIQAQLSTLGPLQAQINALALDVNRLKGSPHRSPLHAHTPSPAGSPPGSPRLRRHGRGGSSSPVAQTRHSHSTVAGVAAAQTTAFVATPPLAPAAPIVSTAAAGAAVQIPPSGPTVSSTHTGAASQLPTSVAALRLRPLLPAFVPLPPQQGTTQVGTPLPTGKPTPPPPPPTPCTQRVTTLQATIAQAQAEILALRQPHPSEAAHPSSSSTTSSTPIMPVRFPRPAPQPLLFYLAIPGQLPSVVASSFAGPSANGHDPQPSPTSAPAAAPTYAAAVHSPQSLSPRHQHSGHPPVRTMDIPEYDGTSPVSRWLIPPMRGVEHSIQLVPDYHIHHQAPYRLSIPQATEPKHQLEELLRLGFMKPSNSPWGAPILFARKADGIVRFCIDYRGLNRYTVKNNYPMPRADEQFDRLADNRFFTKIDLRSGYHQICVAAEDQPKTAFRSRFGHFEFTVMPFGLTNAPATFQTTMNDIFRGILEEYVLVYLNDILVYSRTLKNHIRHLRDVLQRLRKHGFYAKLNTRCLALDDRIAHMVTIMKRADESLADSQTRMAARANRSRMDHPFKVGDDVLVDARHLQLEADTLRKFRRRFFGPCRILQVVGSDTAASPVSFRVKLPDYLRQTRLHDIYHVSLLRPYRRPSERFVGRPYEHPPPIMVDGHEEFAVSDIVSRRITDDTPPRIEYVVRWKGYPDEEATWEPLEHLEHARILVRAYDHARRAETSAPTQPTDPLPPTPTEEIAKDEPAPPEAILQQQMDASARSQCTRRCPRRLDD